MPGVGFPPRRPRRLRRSRRWLRGLWRRQRALRQLPACSSSVALTGLGARGLSSRGTCSRESGLERVQPSFGESRPLRAGRAKHHERVARRARRLFRLDDLALSFRLKALAAPLKLLQEEKGLAWQLRVEGGRGRSSSRGARGRGPGAALLQPSAGEAVLQRAHLRLRVLT